MSKLKTATAVGLGAGLAVAAVGAALGSYLLSGPRAKNTKRVLRGWMLKAKGEILEKLEKAGDVGEDMYYQAVNEVGLHLKFRKMSFDHVDSLLQFIAVKFKFLVSIVIESSEPTVGTTCVMIEEHHFFNVMQINRGLQFSEIVIPITLFDRRGKYLSRSGGRLWINPVNVLTLQESLENPPKPVIHAPNGISLGIVVIEVCFFVLFVYSFCFDLVL